MRQDLWDLTLRLEVLAGTPPITNSQKINDKLTGNRLRTRNN